MQSSIINYSETKEAGRIDAEFYHPDYLLITDKIKKRNPISLTKIISTFIHPMEIKRNYVEDNRGIQFLRAQNVRSMSIELSSYPVYISEEDSTKLSNNNIYYDDVLITRTGANFGQCGIYLENDQLIASSHTLILRTTICQSFIAIFFNTSHGRKLINKGMYGGSQPEIALSYLKTIKIPIFSEPFQKEIENMVLEAHAKREEAIKLTKEANELLEKELGLCEWTPQKHRPNISTQMYSVTKQANRIDAEYYQPKYDEIINKIKSYKGGFESLGDLYKNYSTGFPFDSKKYTDNGFALIRINNIKKGDLELSNATYITNDDVNLSLKDIVKENDLLISMSGTIGNCCKIPKNTKAIINQRILKISVKDYNPDALMLIINSTIGSLQLERIGTGGVQTNISNKDIFNILIPIIDKNIQDIIADKIKTAHQARSQAKTLLENAKAKVEGAIENGE